jgi:hypothetical protein
VALALAVLANIALVCGMWAELRRFRAEAAEPVDWPKVNAFLAKQGCIPATREVLTSLAGEAGYAATYDADTNTMTLADRGETVRLFVSDN